MDGSACGEGARQGGCEVAVRLGFCVCVVSAGASKFMIESLWAAAIDAKALVPGAKNTKVRKGTENKNFLVCM